jgi:hypothetical protein
MHNRSSYLQPRHKNKSFGWRSQEKPDCQELNINIMVNWFIESFGMQRHETYRIFDRALT